MVSGIVSRLSFLSKEKFVNQYKLQDGFTLFELLIALFVFSLLSVFAFRSVTILSSSQQGLTLEQYETEALQRALFFWDRDVRNSNTNITQSELRDNRLEADLIASFLLETGSSGRREEIGVERINYFLDNGSIYRESVGELTDRTLLISNIKSASANLIEGGRVGLKKKAIVGIELVMVHQELGQIKRQIFQAVGEADKDLSTLISEGSGGTAAGGSGQESNGSEVDGIEGGEEPVDVQTPVFDPLGGTAPW